MSAGGRPTVYSLALVVGAAKWLSASQALIERPRPRIAFTTLQHRACPVNSTVELSFRYQERDYVRAMRAHFASRLRLRLDIFLAVVVTGVGAYLWRTPALQWFGLACILLAVVFILLIVAAFTVIPRLAFRREPKFRDEYSLTFSPDGIHFRTAHLDSQLQWSMYSHALMDAHSYVLYYGSHQFTVIPKRVFQSVEQQQSFEQLLTHHVSRIVRRDT